MSGLLKLRDNVEAGAPPKLPWLEGTAAVVSVGRDAASTSPCVPDEDLELEWIHGYSAQVSKYFVKK